MSTVTVVRKNNQIAICADTMTKWNSEKNTAKYVVNHSKILKVRDNYIAITGPQSGIFALKDYFEHEIKKEDNTVNFQTVDHIYKTWLKLHQSLKEEYFLDVNKSEEPEFESGCMDVLIANSHGIFGITAFRDIQEFSRFYSYGSGNQYALGAMHSIYDDHTLNLDAIKIAKLGVTAAAEFDDATGLPLECHVININN